jgi:hypothetical protein
MWLTAHIVTRGLTTSELTWPTSATWIETCDHCGHVDLDPVAIVRHVAQLHVARSHVATCRHVDLGHVATCSHVDLGHVATCSHVATCGHVD